MNKDLVSVIIPIYNSEQFLEQSINSVLNQTWNSIEIIAIDDGSNDNSAKILKKYSNQIKVISQPNQGLAITLKNGINQMNGYWFKWFSPDDILYPEAIETLVNKAKQLPENTILYSNWELIDENGKKLRNFSESNYNDLINFEFNIRMLDGQQINVNTSLIPYPLFEKGCMIRGLQDPVAIDYDFFLSAGILFDTSFYLIPRTLVGYRIHSKQLSHKKITKTLSYLDTVRDNILSNLDDSKKEKYLNELNEYKKNQPFSKKALKLGLKLTIDALPEEVTDRLLIFYLNKIRRSR